MQIRFEYELMLLKHADKSSNFCFSTSFCLVLNVVNPLHFLVVGALPLPHLGSKKHESIFKKCPNSGSGWCTLLCTLHLLLQEINKKVMNVVRINAVLCFITTLIPPTYQ